MASRPFAGAGPVSEAVRDGTLVRGPGDAARGDMNFFGLGLPEMLVIGVLALIFIGPEKLPGVIRDVMGFYRQVRSLGSEWREQVEREIGTDLRDLTKDVNQGLEAFGRSIEQQIQAVDEEIKDAQATAVNGSAPTLPASPDLPALTPPVPVTADGEDEDERPKSIDYLPG
jgi:sec-independent protein translocase protein TatB